MATSDRGGGGAVLRYLESKKNLAGCAGGVAGLGLTVAGVAGPFWWLVVAGLYGAGALIAPPDVPVLPEPGVEEQLGALRDDLGRFQEYLEAVESLPAAASQKLDPLMGLYGALLDPGWAPEVVAADPEAVHALSRAIRQDLPECVDTYLRTRWWNRLPGGAESPERHLERQLAVLLEEAERWAATLREAEARRQETHTTYLEDRGRS
ncbi:hypothetical protein [Streptomyces sp. NPDC090022]|uniref:hypothetical protein n=1 Tax=Streptomyces sp. NPDC090022 TaxID=3365920 RepID=UPI00382BD231